jgi:hypothetical protein
MAYRILVVDDDADTRELLDFTVRWSGHMPTPQKAGERRSNYSLGAATMSSSPI